MKSNPLITDLGLLVESLPAAERAQFHQIYGLSTTVGEVTLQPGLETWVKAQFGSVEAITHQKIVRLLNRVTQEEVFVNEQRASRPTEGKSQINLAEELQNAARTDIFAEPGGHISEDIIGRIRGQFCLTAGNITKTDGYHGVVIFNDLNPLAFTREKVFDYLDTGRQWAEQIYALKPEAKYFLFFWNCLWRAGASLSHGLRLPAAVLVRQQLCFDDYGYCEFAYKAYSYLAIREHML